MLSNGANQQKTGESGLDFIYQQLRLRKLADTRLIISTAVLHQNIAKQRALIDRLRSQADFKIQTFATHTSDKRDIIASTLPTSTKPQLHYKCSHLTTELVFVLHHETHDGIGCLQIICDAIGYKYRLPRLKKLRNDYSFTTISALANLIRLRTHKQLHNPNQHAQINCSLDIKNIRHKKNKLSLADSVLLHIIKSLQASLKSRTKNLTVGKISALPQTGNNNFSINIANINLDVGKLNLQLQSKFKNRSASGLYRLFATAKLLPFYCTRKIVELISTRVDVMFSFVPLLGSSEDSICDIRIASVDKTNAVFVYVVKNKHKLNVSIMLNSNKICPEKLQHKLMRM